MSKLSEENRTRLIIAAIAVFIAGMMGASAPIFVPSAGTGAVMVLCPDGGEATNRSFDLVNNRVGTNWRVRCRGAAPENQPSEAASAFVGFLTWLPVAFLLVFGLRAIGRRIPDAPTGTD